MSIRDALRHVELNGWCLCDRAGALVEPATGYIVPIRRREWWSVYARRLDVEIVELFVYSRAPRFAADPALLLHAVKFSDHYVLSTALLARRLGDALRLAFMEHGDEIYGAPDHRSVTRKAVGSAA